MGDLKGKACIFKNNRFVAGESSNGLYLEPQANSVFKNCTFREAKLKWWQLRARFQRWMREKELKRCLARRDEE